MQLKLDPGSIPQIPGARIAILQSKWYREYTDKMVDACVRLLESTKCLAPEIHILPGSLELPLAAQDLIRNNKNDFKYDALICIGAILKGDTYHFDVVKDVCMEGLAHVMLSEGVPIIIEVTPVDNLEHLVARSQDNSFNKGVEAAIAAAEVISWRRQTLRS